MTDMMMMQMHHPHIYAPQIDPQLYVNNGHQMMTPMTHHSIVPNGVAMTVSDHSTEYPQYPHLPPDCGPSPFLPEDGMSPYGMPPTLPMHGNVSPMLEHLDATRYHGAEIHRNHTLPLGPQPHAIMHFPQTRHRASSASGTRQAVLTPWSYDIGCATSTANTSSASLVAGSVCPVGKSAYDGWGSFRPHARFAHQARLELSGYPLGTPSPSRPTDTIRAT